MNSSKGFLFTIGIIFFASTLVLFAQGFYESNLVSEGDIISSYLPINIVLLNNDIANDVVDLFGLSFDINSLNNSLTLFGRMNSSANELASLSSYSSFVSSTYFPRIVFDESLDLSTLADGKAEFFLGDNLNLDYNYGNSLALFSFSPNQFESVDVNLKTSGTLSYYEWVGVEDGNNFFVSINYSDDSNSVIINDLIGNDSFSYLNLVYPDGNTLISFGSVNYAGSNYSSAFLIDSKLDQVIDYELKADYSRIDFYPIKINSILRVNSDKFDSNTFLTIYK